MDGVTSADVTLIYLSDDQVDDLETRLQEYDQTHLPAQTEGRVQIGIDVDGRLVAGVDAQVSGARTLYVSTVFVDEEYRGKGLGRALMAALEERATELGTDLIRLDTYGWQGPGFYRALGYEEVGHYDTGEGGPAEHFFLKRLR